MSKLFEDFYKSVEDLSSKLPQWSDGDLIRFQNSMISSLYEEVGEICGLVSKYRVRKDYWKSDFSTLELDNQEEIINKFVDESADTLWVIFCSLINYQKYLYLYVDATTLEKIFIDKQSEYNISFEESVYDLMDSIAELKQITYIIPPKCKYYPIILNNFINVVTAFKQYLFALSKEYNIYLEDLMQANMEKLGNRYDKNGKRIDGK